MFDFKDAIKFSKQKYLLVACILLFIVSVSIITIEFFLNIPFRRPGFAVAAFGTAGAIVLLISGRYRVATIYCSVLFSVAIGVGTFFGPSARNVNSWYPVFFFYHLFFTSRKHTIAALGGCVSLVLIHFYFYRAPSELGVLFDSLGALLVLSLLGLAISKAMEQVIEDKDVLLKELHHRVRNNLQVMLGMISLLKDSEDSLDLEEALSSLERKILALSNVHSHAHVSRDFSHVFMKEVFASYLPRILPRAGNRLRLDFQDANTLLNVREASIVAMIAGEVLVHCIDNDEKSSDLIRVGLTWNHVDEYILSMEGAILPDGKGREFIEMLVQQLKGELDVDQKTPGSCIVRFKSTK
ncbi:hypothetical protein CH373_05380 [Leptospira perolatii]|uniref:histidine kinase n=2 Tax=Leptospira perolatii TaxID=2023191 RepID=A0A2M9ZQU6_9LEPT|nr:hypothetical protein CH360_05800 [Leptospira perolatii]PJZ74339.1 hypothetical protein CH373_05380 [Leptospira perolatii]